MTRARYGEQCSCARCGQDIEFHGWRKWVDRGGNRQCPPYEGRDREIIDPQGRFVHHPYRSED